MSNTTEDMDIETANQNTSSKPQFGTKDSASSINPNPGQMNGNSFSALNTNNINTGSSLIDEGFAEPYRIDYIMNVWKYHCTDQQKLSMALQLLQDLPAPMLSRVAMSILPRLHVDFIRAVPYEIGVKIIGMCNLKTLLAARSVSRRWNRICSDAEAWKAIYNKRDWNNRIPGYSNINVQSIVDENNAKGLRSEIDGGSSSSSFWKEMFKTHTDLERRWKSFTPVISETRDEHQDSIYSLQFDDKKLVTGSRDHTVKVWDLETKTVTKVITGHVASVLCLQFDAEGTLFTGSSDSKIRKFNLNTGECLGVIGTHDAGVINLKFDPKYLVTSSKDHTVKVWDNSRADHPHARSLIGHTAAINSVGYTYPLVFSASGDQTIKIWNVETGECRRTLEGHNRGLACIHSQSNSNDGDSSSLRLVSGSTDCSIKLWDIEYGSCIRTFLGHTQVVRAVQIDNHIIMSGSYDETVKIWDARTGNQITSLNHNKRVFKLQFNHRRLITTGQSGTASFWDLGHGLDPRFI